MQSVLHGMAGPYLPHWIVALSAGAIATAYTAQYGFGVEPCILCLYQRIPYAVAAVLSLGAVFSGAHARAWLVRASGVVFIAGACVAFYHVGVEQHWWSAVTNCGAAPGGPLSFEDFRAQLHQKAVVRCDAITWSLFGLSMATYNVGVFLVLAAGALLGAGRMVKGGAP